MESSATGVDISAISTALQTGLQSTATQTISVMALIAPYGISLFVAVLVVNYAKKFFKKIAG